MPSSSRLTDPCRALHHCCATSTSLLLVALTTTAGQLIGARALMGIGAALILPAALAIVIAVFTDTRERATAIGIWSGLTGLAAAAG